MERSNEDLALDGNAVGGLLAEIYSEDVTALDGRCPDCGARSALATLKAYTHAPGVVLRCASCDAIQIVIVRTPRGLRHEVRREMSR